MPFLHAIRPAAILLAAVAVAGCKTAQAGWTYAPAPSTTPVPSAAASSAPTPAPSTDGTVLKLVAETLAFDKLALEAPAGKAFKIELDNQASGVPHDVWIKDGAGNIVLQDDFFNGVATKTYDVPALTAGTYTFYCSVHPVAAMTGTLTVK